MSIVELLEHVQDTAISQLIRETTWGYPIVGALHVMAIAIFGGAVLVTDLRALGVALGGDDFQQLTQDLRPMKRVGFLMVMLTGILLFASQPVRYSNSLFFRVKLALLVLIFLNAGASRRSPWISLLFWAAVLLASRGIAYF